MYGYIKGVVTEVTPKYIVEENNGIGYILIVPNPYSFEKGKDYKIYTYLHVREDVFDLYGFKEEDQRDLFLKLISVSGIGPKSALSILAAGSVKEIVLAIENRNDVYLKKFPGIGQKASQQIILDLRGKLNYDNSDTIIPVNSKIQDVEEALVSLGYNKKELKKVLSKLDASKDINDLIKEALRILANV